MKTGKKNILPVTSKQSGIFVVATVDLFVVSQGYNKVDKRLVITTCANQDPLQASTGNMIFID